MRFKSIENKIKKVRGVNLKNSPYIRVGSCNGCGKCCDMQRNLAIADELNRRGIDFVFPDHFPCFHYEREKCVCGIYDRRPVHCREWPTKPEDLFGYPECGYNFIKKEK